MSTALLSAALLTIFIGVVHSWLGERRLIGPLLAPGRRQGLLEASAFARGTLRFAWHITTLAWFGLAGVLIVMAGLPEGPQAAALAVVIAATFAVSGLITLVASRGRHLAWPVFLAIAALAMTPIVLPIVR
jgi:hypothetical protein